MRFFFFLTWRLRSAALGLVARRAAVFGGRLLGQRAVGSASVVKELPTRFRAHVSPGIVWYLGHSRQCKQFLAHVPSLRRAAALCPSALPLLAGARPHQPQRGGSVTASVPQVSLTLAAAEPSPACRSVACRRRTSGSRWGPAPRPPQMEAQKAAAAARSHD